MGKYFRLSSWCVLLTMMSNMLSPVAFATRLESILGEQAGGGTAEYSLGKSTGLTISVNLIGGIGSPGIYHIPDGTEMLTLLTAAGGPRPMAELDEVQIRRRQEGGYVVYRLDVEEMMNDKNAPLHRLQNGDFVFVPEAKSTFTQDFIQTLGVVGSIMGIIVGAVAISKIK